MLVTQLVKTKTVATGRQVKGLESNEERGQKEELPQIFVLFVFLFV